MTFIKGLNSSEIKSTFSAFCATPMLMLMLLFVLLLMLLQLLMMSILLLMLMPNCLMMSNC